MAITRRVGFAGTLKCSWTCSPSGRQRCSCTIVSTQIAGEVCGRQIGPRPRLSNTWNWISFPAYTTTKPTILRSRERCGAVLHALCFRPRDEPGRSLFENRNFICMKLSSPAPVMQTPPTGIVYKGVYGASSGSESAITDTARRFRNNRAYRRCALWRPQRC